MSQTTLKHNSSLYTAMVNLIHYNPIVRTLFPVESTNNIKFKKSCSRVIGDGCILDVMSFMNACFVSQSVIYQVLNGSDGVFKRKSLMEK